jgi:hypothetical protein
VAAAAALFRGARLWVFVVVDNAGFQLGAQKNFAKGGFFYSSSWMSDSSKRMNDSSKWMNDSSRWMNDSSRWMNDSSRWMNDSDKWRNHSDKRGIYIEKRVSGLIINMLNRGSRKEGIR